jgi:hypothetical protein
MLNCTVSSSSGSDGFLDGDIADAVEHAPIQKAFLYIHSRVGNDTVAEPMPRGRFHVALTPGIYDVFVATKGFAPTCKAVTIREGQTHLNTTPD